MTPDVVTLMIASQRVRAESQSALPDAPVIADFMDRSPRGPRFASLRKQLASAIWPGELTLPTIEHPSPAPVPGC